MNINNVQLTYLLFAVFAVILVIASSIGFILKQKSGANPAPVIDNLNARINAWWIMLIVLAAAILLGQTAFIVLFGLISFFCLKGIYKLIAHPTR